MGFNVSGKLHLKKLKLPIIQIFKRFQRKRIVVLFLNKRRDECFYITRDLCIKDSDVNS